MDLSNGTITGFREIAIRLSAIRDQTMGIAGAICEAGEPYVELSDGAYARPDDVEKIEVVVANRMWRQLDGYLNKANGRVYWRMPFEYDIHDSHFVERFDVNGPDTDPMTDRKCVLDKNWKLIRCYCRLYRATLPLPEPSSPS